jgi:hypothetical protein
MIDLSQSLGVLIGGILTLIVFSYLLGDTPLFRVAQAIFVGVTVGYAATVAVDVVLRQRMIEPLLADPEGYWYLVIPALVLGVILLTKLRAEWAPIGNISIAFLFGVGGALAIGGALRGTLLPQLSATVVPLNSIENIFLVVGTIGAFLSFRFIKLNDRPAARALDALNRGWGYIGRWFILIAFGAIFADTAVSRISILISRIHYILHDWLQVIR